MSDEFQSVWLSADEAAHIVRQSYGAVVPTDMRVAESLYDPQEIVWLPASVKSYALGLGNPIRYAELHVGEIVLDVGSGAGIDTFIAARQVGPSGRAIGVEMTEAMAARARRGARAAALANVEVRDGDAIALPVDTESADVVITNGVVNLIPEKETAVREMYRVLKPGGQLLLADIALDSAVSDEARRDIDLWTA